MNTSRTLLRIAVLHGVAILGCANPVTAQQTRTWVGTSAELDTAANWSPSGVPSASAGDLMLFDASGIASDLTFPGGTFSGNDGLGGISVASGQTNALSIRNTGSSGSVFRLQGGAGLEIEDGAGAVTIGGGGNWFYLNMGTGTSNFVNNSDNLATLGSNVRLNATGSTHPNVAFSGTGDWLLAGGTSGTVVSLSHAGPGTLTLTGSNAYYGGTTISDGTLQVGDGGSTGSLGFGQVVNNGTLVFNRNDNVNMHRVSGSGDLVMRGTGTVTVLDSNTYAGSTTIEAGTLKLGVATSAGNPVGYWEMSEGSGTTIDNSVTGSPNGSLLNSAGWVEGPGGEGTHGADFSGSNQQHASLGRNAALDRIGTDAFTVSAWVKSDLEGSWYHAIVSNFGTSSRNAFWGLGWMDGDQLGFVIRDGQSPRNEVRVRAPKDWGLDDEWHHLVGVRDGEGSFHLYLDGTLEVTADDTVGNASHSTNILLARHGGTYVQESVAGVGIWSYALDADDVKQLYDRGLAPSGGTLPETTGLQIAADGTFDLNGINQTVASLADRNGSGGTVLLGGGILTVAGDDIATMFSGAIAGAGGLVKTGSGTLTLSGANTYEGGTTISGGRITIGNLNALGGGLVTVNAVGTLALNGHNIANAITLAGGTLDVGTTGTVSSNITLDDVIGNTIRVTGNYRELNGRLTGPGGFTLTGSSTPGLTLSNPNNDFTGNVIINSGAYLRLTAAEVIPDVVNVTNNGHLRLDISGGGTETIDGLSGSGSVWVPTTNNAMHTLVVGANNATSTYAGTIGRSGQNNARLALEKTGSGELTLTGRGYHTGGTTVSGGTLHIDVSRGFNQGYYTGLDNIVYNVDAGATLDFGGAWNSRSNNTVNLRGGTLHFSHSDDRNYVNRINMDTAPSTVSSVAGFRGGYFFSPTTTVEASASGSLISSDLVFVNDTTPRTWTFSIANGAQAADLTISGNIEDYPGLGGVRLIKTGAGTMVLSGNNTHTGATTINGGTLLVNGTHTGAGAYTVNQYGTLGGTGSISGPTTIHDGAFLAPGGASAHGQNVGMIEFTDNLTLQPGATLLWEFVNNNNDDDDDPGESYDAITGPQLILPGEEAGRVNVSILGLTDEPGYRLSAGDSFTLFDGAVSRYIGNELTPFDHGADVSHLFTITDDIGWWGTWEVTAGSLVLTAVPEPGTWLLLLSALASGLLMRRRKA